MRTRNIKVIANQDVPESQGGRVLTVVSLSAGTGVRLTWLDTGGQDRGVVTNVKPGQEYRPGFAFGGFSVRGTVDADLEVIVSDGDAYADLAEKTALITNGAGQAVPVDVLSLPAAMVVADRLQVDVGAGVVEVTADNVGIVPNGVAIGEPAAVAVDDTLDALIAADADRVSIRFYNQGPDPVALGAAGLTWAKRAVVLEAGDTWVETDGAALAWSGITDAGDAATVGIQTVTR